MLDRWKECGLSGAALGIGIVAVFAVVVPVDRGVEKRAVGTFRLFLRAICCSSFRSTSKRRQNAIRALRVSFERFIISLLIVEDSLRRNKFIRENESRYSGADKR
jgi:hypothetical protein